MFPCWDWAASVAQLAEQLICNQQVVGSSPSASLLKVLSIGLSRYRQRQSAVVGTIRLQGKGFQWLNRAKGGFPSGQRGQTVNLMAMPSQVRILHPPLVN